MGSEASMTAGPMAGFTWAGAADDAVRAAITVKAERIRTNMKTVTCAVNRPLGWLREGSVAEGDSPTAWHLNHGLHRRYADAPRVNVGS